MQQMLQDDRLLLGKKDESKQRQFTPGEQKEWERNERDYARRESARDREESRASSEKEDLSKRLSPQQRDEAKKIPKPRKSAPEYP
jgi:hypothetical protein